MRHATGDELGEGMGAVSVAMDHELQAWDALLRMAAGEFVLLEEVEEATVMQQHEC